MRMSIRKLGGAHELATRTELGKMAATPRIRVGPTYSTLAQRGSVVVASVEAESL